MLPPGLILLAAGGSSRMGRPKQLLPWQGRTLLRHACETALGTGCRPIIVVLGNEAAACAREINDLPITPIVNPDWHNGLGSSIAVGTAALEKAKPDISGIMVLLADQPSVTPTLLGQLLDAWLSGEHPIVATKYSQGGGVPALLARAYFEELQQLDSDCGARTLIAREHANVHLVQLSEPLIDLDTPAAYLAAQAGS
jgi:molybdenum cofactor cytidylyltransferase